MVLSFDQVCLFKTCSFLRQIIGYEIIKLDKKQLLSLKHEGGKYKTCVSDLSTTFLATPSWKGDI